MTTKSFVNLYNRYNAANIEVRSDSGPPDIVEATFSPSSGNKLNSVSESRKTLILQGFPGFLFFTGYKLATSGRFFVAIVFCGYHVKLIGYFGLLIRVQMAVGFSIEDIGKHIDLSERRHMEFYIFMI